MGTKHGGTVIIKPISEVATYKKNLIPANIPDTYALKPMFANIASEENIRRGVIAFKDFLHLFFDRLTEEGHLYAKPPKKPASIADYPFLHNITNLLVDIGYYSKLSESGDSLLITELPSCAAPKPKIPASTKAECLRFLTFCGFAFTDSEVSYPSNPILLTGLKALSVADMELRTTRRYWNDNNLLRCDYRLMKAESSDMLDVLKDLIHPLPEKLQEFAVRLHQRYTNMGMTCVLTIRGNVSLSYAKSTQDIYSKRVWEFSYSLKDGYCLYVRAKKTKKYADVIEKFPSYLQEKIANGYGCDRKRGEPCQYSCQGICLPLDDSILEVAKDIEIWLDSEI